MVYGRAMVSIGRDLNDRDRQPRLLPMSPPHGREAVLDREGELHENAVNRAKRGRSLQSSNDLARSVNR